mgnify:FL=1
MNYREAYETGKGTLAAAGIEEAELDARLLLEEICGTDRNTLLVHGDRNVTEEELAQYKEMLEKRSVHIPLQQIIGRQSFMGLDFYVDENVLIPRQDTELLVEEALQELHDGMRILDMCTGSGCILLSLLKYSNDCEGIGADISEEALKVAERNRVQLGLENAAFIRSDLFEAVEGKFDLLVSNPPYICSDVIDTLMPEVREHEPRQALDGSADGLHFYRRILAECRTYLKPGGMLLFEIGYDQGEAVKRLMEENGFLEVEVKKDYGRLDRVVLGTLGFEV